MGSVPVSHTEVDASSRVLVSGAGGGLSLNWKLSVTPARVRLGAGSPTVCANNLALKTLESQDESVDAQFWVSLHRRLSRVQWAEFWSAGASPARAKLDIIAPELHFPGLWLTVLCRSMPGLELCSPWE